MIKTVVRIILGFIFLFVGIVHFVKTSEMAVYVPVPYGAVQFVYITGTIIIISSLCIIINRYLLTSLITLSITLVVSALLVQLPIFLREREYILQVIGLSNLVKLTLATLLLLMALYYKQKSK